MRLAAYLAEQSNAWDRIVAKYGLRPLSLRELVGHDDQRADFAFTYGAPEGPRALSTIKLRQAGFTEAIGTEDEFCNALQFTHRPQLPAARDDLTSAKVLSVGRPSTRGIHFAGSSALVAHTSACALVKAGAAKRRRMDR
jgi:hypothetical protein